MVQACMQMRPSNYEQKLYSWIFIEKNNALYYIYVSYIIITTQMINVDFLSFGVNSYAEI